MCNTRQSIRQRTGELQPPGRLWLRQQRRLYFGKHARCVRRRCSPKSPLLCNEELRSCAHKRVMSSIAASSLDRCWTASTAALARTGTRLEIWIIYGWFKWRRQLRTHSTTTTTTLYDPGARRRRHRRLRIIILKPFATQQLERVCENLRV